MIRQTWVILLDAYRELNARRLFWITLVLSGLVVLVFALLGVSDAGELTIAGFEVPLGIGMLEAEAMYKGLFVHFGIGFWLSWLAAILALVSTAGIFPEMISSGSVAMLMSKPIGRVRLFLTKYAGGLLFVTLQVSVFTLASFLVLGLRAGLWEPGLLLAIPLVVLFFSYLFCVCVLLGLITRSTIAALLLTLLVWFGFWAVHSVENTILQFRVHAEHEIARIEAGIEHGPPREVDARQSELEQAQRELDNLALAHRIALGVATVVPKTGETIDLLRQALYETTTFQEQEDEHLDRWQQQQAALDEAIRQRSAWWVIGSSLGFEAVVLVLAGWLFHRRDF